MDREDLREAIGLFEFSRTARISARAPAVVRKLWDLYAHSEIAFRDLGRSSRHGSFEEDRADEDDKPEPDLLVNLNYIKSLPGNARLGALSVLLVHEGQHATDDFARLYSELAARMLQIHYFRELCGPGVFNEANDPPQAGRQWGTIRLSPTMLPWLQKQSELLDRDQLIDYVLSIKTYRDEDYFDLDWVVGNLANWGGPANRWPETRGRFIRLLAPTVEDRYHAAIVDLMEGAKGPQEWKAMMDKARDKAGSLRTIQRALDDLSTLPQYGRRIVALEQKWRVTLREAPPVR